MSDPRQITLTDTMRDALAKHSDQHKYDHGHALILSGGVGRGGAARLAARGALRVGAGLVTVAFPPAALIENAAQLTAIMLRSLKDADALAAVLNDKRLSALCLGPGLGLDRAREMVPIALAAGRGTVLDADALSAFSDDPSTLLDGLHAGCVITPHGGEFARLFPDLSERLLAEGSTYSKVDAARDAAIRAGCVVVFKGSETVIAASDGDAAINLARNGRAVPWLATAGTGDVLAGFLTGLLARRIEPPEAAEIAVWLHTEVGRHVGPGLIAEDLPEAVPAIFRSLDL